MNRKKQIAYLMKAFRAPVPSEMPRRQHAPMGGSTPLLVLWHDKDCPYCGEKMLFGTNSAPTRDHIYPRWRGGTLCEANRLIVCWQCNMDKGGKTLAKWGERLKYRGDRRAQTILSLASTFAQE